MAASTSRFDSKWKDTLTACEVTFKKNGTAIDLENYTVKARFQLGAVDFERTMTKVAPDTNGVAKYTPVAADFDGTSFLEGIEYNAEFYLTDGAGLITKLPNTGFNKWKFHADTEV